MVGTLSGRMGNSQLMSGWATRSKDYGCLRKRVRMVSFETLRTFEMILAVSLTGLKSRLTSKDSLVESLTIIENEY